MTATGTSRGVPAALALAVAVAVAGCASAGARSPGSASSAAARSPSSAPRGWVVQRSPLGAALATPPGWTRARGDRDSLSAVQRSRDGALIGYLNLTPRQGAENAAQWRRFRLAHLRGDGEHAVREIAYAPGVRMAGGRAACLTDAYTTATNARYEELACIVEGTRTAVVLGAAPPADWAGQEPVIARAIATATP